MSGEGSINPFQTVLCSCVICEQEASYSRLKTTLYTETKRDIDLRPITVLWANKVSPRVDPKLFYFWQCPACGYTADYQFFLSPFKDGSMSVSRFRKMFRKAKQANSAYESILQSLRIDARQDKVVFITGLKLNLMAVYILEMIEEIAQGESLILASYYLRLAWMMRDIRSSQDRSPEVYQQAKTLVTHLQRLWPKLSLSETDCLQTALHYYQQALQKSHGIHTMLQELKVRLLVTRILIKTGKLPDAKRVMLECRSKVNNYEAIYKRKSKNQGTFSDDDIQEMENSLTKAQTLIRNVEQIYLQIEAIKIDKQVKEFQQLLQGMQDRTYEEKLALLQSKEAPQEVIDRVLPAPKKKGLMGLLKSS